MGGKRSRGLSRCWCSFGVLVGPDWIGLGVGYRKRKKEKKTNSLLCIRKNGFFLHA